MVQVAHGTGTYAQSVFMHAASASAGQTGTDRDVIAAYCLNVFCHRLTISSAYADITGSATAAKALLLPRLAHVRVLALPEQAGRANLPMWRMISSKSFSQMLPNADCLPTLQEISRFLRHPRKPAILAMSRPDAKKNITTLVKAFGQNPMLRELSNLVLVMVSILPSCLGGLWRARLVVHNAKKDISTC